MSYYLDMSKISIDEYQNMLETMYLIPSQRFLRDDIIEKFKILKSKDILTMEMLYLALKTKRKVEILSSETGIDLDYLIVLRRAVSSHKPKPRNLSDYPFLEESLIARLKELDIVNSYALYAYLQAYELDHISEILKIDFEAIEYIKALLNVTRLRYASPLFATVLVESNYTNVSMIAEADEEALYQTIMITNVNQNIYKGKIGMNDVKFLIEDAKLLIKFSK